MRITYFLIQSEAAQPTSSQRRCCFLPLRYISGSIHYSRVPPFYWNDRLRKIRAAGLNAIQTYIPWNFHEPSPGVYNFTAEHDIVKFLNMAHDLGLLVILRPGPYICAEWDMGGLPSWLLTHDNILLRTSDPTYLSYVDKWLAVLLPKMQPLLYENGGPIISVQVENEYGSYYACDHDYMQHLEDTFREHLGPNVVLFTTDGNNDNDVKCGMLPSLYVTVDFGTSSNGNIDGAFKAQRDFEPSGPLVNSEFYTGWLDYWGSPHSHVPAQLVESSLNEILALNASVNMYMFEGGTSFAFWNGADPTSGQYLPQPTSYDYDAPLSEAGDPTAKYTIIRELLSTYTNVSGDVPPPTPKAAYGKVNMKQVGSLWESLEMLHSQTGTMTSNHPITFENLGHSFGFVIYSTSLPSMVASNHTWNLSMEGVHDRASVFLNNQPVGVVTRITRDLETLNVTLSNPSPNDMLDIVVENMGRLNYGSYINDSKGIIGDVYLTSLATGKQFMVSGEWTSAPIPLDNFDWLTFHSLLGYEGTPSLSVVFYSAEFSIEGEPKDTFLNIDNWTKGVAFVNGFNLGRYWPKRGPQKTLYVPASILSASVPNILMLFEIDAAPCETPTDCYATFVDTPDIG